MKSPRFLAALAMAAVLTTGTTAHAAFNQVGGSATNGQTPMQEAQEFNANNTNLNVEGDISLDGTFTKTINNFPTPTQDGHYLRITMPIKMDYTYDVDTNVMQSTDMVVTNNSVYATNTNQTPATLEYKKVKMTIVDFKKNDKGITTMAPNIKFVEDAATEALTDKDNVLLPFELQVKSSSGSVDNISIEKIQVPTGGGSATNGLNPIEIAPNSALTLKLEQINGQTIGNKDLISQQTSKTSHNLKLKFEYVAN